MQAMDCKALAQGREPLLKVALIQLAEQGSILSVTLAHCVSGMQHLMAAAGMLPVSHSLLMAQLQFAAHTCLR